MVLPNMIFYKKLKKYLLAASVLLVLHTSSLTAQEPMVIDQVVAVVGRNIILQSEIENQYIQFRLQRGISGTAEEIRCQILEDLLFQKLMLNQAEVDSVTVTSVQVEMEMESRLRYFVNELGSQERLEQFYNKSINEIKDELRRLVQDQMLVEQVQRDIMAKVQVTPSEVRTFFRSIPKDSIPMVPAEYEIAHIIKKPPISIDEKLAIRERLHGLRQRILGGERFSTLAILFSEDPGSARKGGELGLYARGELYPEFEAVAFRLKDGEVSEIVETEAGFHILQLIERRGEYVNVRHILLTAKPSPDALQAAHDELDSIAALIRTGQITFDEAVIKFSDEENKTDGGMLLNPYTGGIRFEAEQLDPQVSFVIDKLQVGELSDPVPMKTQDGKDAFRLLKIKHKTTPHIANIREDYNRIQGWALANKRQQAVNKWIENKTRTAFVNIIDEFSDCNFQFTWREGL
jgi:peptidyl-prolyl cis-trans isomerase SurA